MAGLKAGGGHRRIGDEPVAFDPVFVRVSYLLHI